MPTSVFTVFSQDRHHWVFEGLLPRRFSRVSPERPFSQNGGVKTGMHPPEGLHLCEETLEASQGPHRAPTPNLQQRHPPAGKLPADGRPPFVLMQ